MRVRVSRPYWSVPSRYSAEGPCIRTAGLTVTGSGGVSHGARTAESDTSSTMISPLRPAPERSSLCIADPGVNQRVDDVEQQADADESSRDEENRALHDRVVAQVDPFKREAADTGQAEHLFDDHRATEQRSELQAHHRDDGVERVAQSVTHHDRELADAFGAGGPHEVPAHHLQHRGAGDAGDGS